MRYEIKPHEIVKMFCGRYGGTVFAGYKANPMTGCVFVLIDTGRRVERFDIPQEDFFLSEDEFENKWLCPLYDADPKPPEYKVRDRYDLLPLCLDGWAWGSRIEPCDA
jgi:hypothetical protein